MPLLIQVHFLSWFKEFFNGKNLTLKNMGSIACQQLKKRLILGILCFLTITDVALTMDKDRNDPRQDYKLTSSADAGKLNKQFYDKHISQTEAARNGDAAERAQVSIPLTPLERSRVRISASRLPNSTRNTGYDEVYQTAQTDDLRQRDAGLRPGVKPIGTINGEKVTHLSLQRDIRPSTAFMPFPGEQGGIIGGHPGTFSKDPRDSRFGFTEGSPKFHKRRQEYMEKSSNPVSMALRGVNATLIGTATREDFVRGFIGKHEGPVYDYAGRDIKQPENLQAYFKDYARQRNQLKRVSRSLMDQSDAESVTTYLPSSDYSDFEGWKTWFGETLHEPLFSFASEAADVKKKYPLKRKRMWTSSTCSKKRQKKDNQGNERGKCKKPDEMNEEDEPYTSEASAENEYFEENESQEGGEQSGISEGDIADDEDNVEVGEDVEEDENP